MPGAIPSRPVPWRDVRHHVHAIEAALRCYQREARQVQFVWAQREGQERVGPELWSAGQMEGGSRREEEAAAAVRRGQHW
jgi:hypothetical protein